jgi:hypothetical protein
MTRHNYTKTDVETAAAAVNAGTCLEDTHVEGDDIILTHVGEAVKQVNLSDNTTLPDAKTVRNNVSIRT